MSSPYNWCSLIAWEILQLMRFVCILLTFLRIRIDMYLIMSTVMMNTYKITNVYDMQFMLESYLNCNTLLEELTYILCAIKLHLTKLTNKRSWCIQTFCPSTLLNLLIDMPHPLVVLQPDSYPICLFMMVSLTWSFSLCPFALWL